MLDDEEKRPVRRRGPRADVAQERETIRFIAPLRDELNAWQETAARLEAIGRAGRGTPDHLKSAERLAGAIADGRHRLDASLTADGTAKVAVSGRVRDLRLALDSAEAAAQRALAVLRKQI